MGTAKASKEPSMEEILASIRQIIADDERLAAPAQQKAVAEAKPEADVPDQDAIDSMFDSMDEDDSSEMDVNDIDALFDAPEETPADKGDATAETEIKEEEAEDDVLALTADQTVESAETASGLDDISFSAADEEEAELPDEIDVVLMGNDAQEEMDEAPASMQAAPVASFEETSALVSSATQSTVKSAFGSLQSAMTVSKAKTVEGLMQDMMRPMLKQWLDDNLPQVVERLVQTEIERLRD